MLISQRYRELNARHHVICKGFGSGGHRIQEHADRLIRQYSGESLLDYGCGKGMLKPAMIARGCALPIHEYDPAIPGKDTAPEPVDIVICRDVMEHIEPDCLNDVLVDLTRVARKVFFANIACRPSGDILPDGSNAHRIVQKPAWWKERIAHHFQVVGFWVNPNGRECNIECTPLTEQAGT